MAARETLRRVLLYSPYCLPYLFSEGRLIMQLEYSSNGKIGGTCFYVGAETLSLEYPFPNTPKSGAMMHAASAASGAAGDADSEKSRKLVSEKVNKSCTRKLLKKLCCAKSEV